jgi:hypothetical protein
MKPLSGRLRLVAAILGCSASFALGQTIVHSADNAQQIVASNQKLSYDGGNKSFQFVGSDDEITITGDCAAVSVVGSNNKLVLDGVGMVQTTGHDNLVTYRHGLNGDNPKVAAIGENNKVVAATQ